MIVKGVSIIVVNIMAIVMMGVVVGIVMIVMVGVMMLFVVLGRMYSVRFFTMGIVVLARRRFMVSRMVLAGVRLRVSWLVLARMRCVMRLVVVLVMGFTVLGMMLRVPFVSSAARPAVAKRDPAEGDHDTNGHDCDENTACNGHTAPLAQ